MGLKRVLPLALCLTAAVAFAPPQARKRCAPWRLAANTAGAGPTAQPAPGEPQEPQGAAAAAAAVPEAVPAAESWREVEFIDWRETNGGWSADLKATVLGKVSRHTIILGRSIHGRISEAAGRQLSPRQVLGAVPYGMAQLGVNLDNSEGMVDTSAFPVNYFSVRQLINWYPDAVEAIAAAAVAEADGA